MTTDEAKAQYKAALLSIISADPLVGPAWAEREHIQGQIVPLIAQLQAAHDPAAKRPIQAQINSLQGKFTALNNQANNSGALDTQAAVDALRRLR